MHKAVNITGSKWNGSEYVFRTHNCQDYVVDTEKAYKQLWSKVYVKPLPVLHILPNII